MTDLNALVVELNAMKPGDVRLLPKSDIEGIGGGLFLSGLDMVLARVVGSNTPDWQIEVDMDTGGMRVRRVAKLTT